MSFQEFSLPGFRDFYPEDCQVRNYIFAQWRAVCRRHNFVEYDAPILQPTELFTGKSGPEIVSQLFNFTDKGGREVTLRPEMTPYVCQMIAAKAASLKRPLRWFSLPECFRYERPQKGRLRSFYQLNADIFDEAGTNAEAEMLSLVVDIFRGFGLTQEHFAIRLSDRTLWLELLGAMGLSLEKAYGVLQIVDKWERETPEEIKNKFLTLCGDRATEIYESVSQMMQIKSLDRLEKFVNEKINAGKKLENPEKLAARLNDWKALMADLKAMGIADYIQVDLGIVRGLAYYTGFVFEVFQKTGEGRALAGGGRYDDLIEKIGGPKMPAFGFGLGDATLIDLLKEQNLLPKFVAGCDVYLAYTSEATRPYALAMAPQLRQAGYSVELSLKNVGFGKQLKASDKAGARRVVILGDDEVARHMCKVKDLSSGKEEEVNLPGLIEYLRG